MSNEELRQQLVAELDEVTERLRSQRTSTLTLLFQVAPFVTENLARTVEPATKLPFVLPPVSVVVTEVS